LGGIALGLGFMRLFATAALPPRQYYAQGEFHLDVAARAVAGCARDTPLFVYPVALEAGGNTFFFGFMRILAIVALPPDFTNSVFFAAVTAPLDVIVKNNKMHGKRGRCCLLRT